LQSELHIQFVCSLLGPLFAVCFPLNVSIFVNLSSVARGHRLKQECRSERLWRFLSNIPVLYMWDKYWLIGTVLTLNELLHVHIWRFCLTLNELLHVHIWRFCLSSLFKLVGLPHKEQSNSNSNSKFCVLCFIHLYKNEKTDKNKKY